MTYYESPIIEILEISVEQGFAGSYSPGGGSSSNGIEGGGSEGMSGGGDINVGW